jgi:hypothetical protein
MGDQLKRSEESLTSHPHEHSVILSCIRDVYKYIGFRTQRDVAERIHKIGEAIAEKEPISKKQALSNLQRKAISENDKQKFFRAALRLIAEHINDIAAYYRPRNVESLQQIQRIISKYESPIRYEDFPAHRQEQHDNIDFTDLIIERWKQPYVSGQKHLRSGVYQMFRRYNIDQFDNDVPKKIIDYWSDPYNQPIICELIYVDSILMQCILVTAEGNLYIGSIFINHEHTMYVIFQRQSTRGVHHRFLMLQLHERRLRIYSGLSIKVGDTITQPLCSEVIFKRIPEKDNEDLYSAMRDLRQEIKSQTRVESNSIIYEYLTDIAPGVYYDENNNASGWARVRFVKNFPALQYLVQQGKFKQPSRTLSWQTIQNLPSELSLQVLRQQGKRKNGDEEK